VSCWRTLTLRSRHVPCRPAAVGEVEAGAAEALGGSNVRRRWRGSACRRVDGRVGEPSWRPGARPLPPPPGDGRRDGESECGAALGGDSTRKGGDTLCSCGVSHALTPSPAYTSDWKTGSQSRMGSVRVRARDELLTEQSEMGLAACAAAGAEHGRRYRVCARGSSAISQEGFPHAEEQQTTPPSAGRTNRRTSHEGGHGCEHPRTAGQAENHDMLRHRDSAHHDS